MLVEGLSHGNMHPEFSSASKSGRKSRLSLEVAITEMLVLVHPGVVGAAQKPMRVWSRELRRDF